MRTMSGLLGAVVAAILIFSLNGCGKSEDKPATTADKIGHAVQSAGDQTGQAIEKAGEAMKEAGEKIKDAAKEGADKMKEEKH